MSPQRDDICVNPWPYFRVINHWMGPKPEGTSHPNGLGKQMTIGIADNTIIKKCYRVVITREASLMQVPAIVGGGCPLTMLERAKLTYTAYLKVVFPESIILA